MKSRILIQKYSIVIILIFFHGLLQPVLAQYTLNDINIEVQGLSEGITDRFENQKNVEAIVKRFNELGVTHSIAPIKVMVKYENAIGTISMQIDFEKYKKYYQTNRDRLMLYPTLNQGKSGIAMVLKYNILVAMKSYKKEVATESNGYYMDKSLLAFQNILFITKKNGDWVSFESTDYFTSRNEYLTELKPSALINTEGEIKQAKTADTNMLNTTYYFVFGIMENRLNGAKMGSYYLKEFFNEN